MSLPSPRYRRPKDFLLRAARTLRHLSDLIRERQKKLLPDYRETLEKWPRTTPMASRISSLPLATYALPALAGACGSPSIAP
ncbi:hypothetical protein GCM10009527_096640 [Actinomadura nitritigenes]